MTETEHHTLHADPVVFTMRDPGMQAPVPHGFVANEMAGGVLHEPGTGDSGVVIVEVHGEAVSSQMVGAGGGGETITTVVIDDDESEDALAEDDDTADEDDDEAGGGPITEEAPPAAVAEDGPPGVAEGTEPVTENPEPGAA